MRQWTTLHKYIWLRILQGANAVYETVKGAIISFTTKRAAPLTELKVEFSPVQDLHGYSNPWPAGGGKNKFDADTVYATYKQSDGSFLGSAYPIKQVQFNIPSGFVGQQLTFSMYVKMPSGSTVANARVMATEDGVEKQGDPYVTSESYTRTAVTFTPTSTDDYVCFNYANGTGDVQLKDIQLEISASATSYAPYENLCPITGWTGFDAYGAGKNLCPITATGTTTSASCTITTNADKSISVSGLSTAQPVAWLRKSGYFTSGGESDNPMNVYFTSGQYILSWASKNGQTFQIQLRNAATGGWISTHGAPVSLNGYYHIRGIGTSGVQYDDTFTFMIRMATESDATYVPYSGQTIPVTFPALGKNTLDPSATTWKKWYLNSNKLGVLTDDSTIVDYSVSGDEITVTITSGNHRGIGFSVDAVDYDRTVSVNGDVPGSIYLFDSYTASAGITRTGANNALTIPANTSGFVAFRWTDGGTYTIKVQFEKGSSSSAYEPYTNTVYGGYADPVLGKLVATWESVDMGNLSWSTFAAGNVSGFVATVSDKADNYHFECSSYNAVEKVRSALSPYEMGVYYNGGNYWKSICVSDPRYTVASDFTSAVVGSQIVYELATPIEFDLTPELINSLKGDNTMWANTNGDIEATYRSN